MPILILVPILTLEEKKLFDNITVKNKKGARGGGRGVEFKNEKGTSFFTNVGFEEANPW